MNKEKMLGTILDALLNDQGIIAVHKHVCMQYTSSIHAVHLVQIRARHRIHTIYNTFFGDSFLFINMLFIQSK